jgi:uncharacterized membrane protein YhdT
VHKLALRLWDLQSEVFGANELYTQSSKEKRIEIKLAALQLVTFVLGATLHGETGVGKGYETFFC